MRRCFARAVELEPADAQMRSNLAAALPHLRAALAVDPGFVPALVNMGEALLNTGDPAGARRFLLEALRRSPGNEAAMELLQRVDDAPEGAGDFRRSKKREVRGRDS